MVARGDLGVEVDFHKVPLIQKDIIKRCHRKSKPVIVATQMMESMINNPTPTRAEANDVANAVLDGADSVMLSGETSIGKYPVETIRNMQLIIDSTETEEYIYNKGHVSPPGAKNFLADSICFSAVQLAEQVNAAAIVTLTHSGFTAIRISSHRPKAPIFTFTMNKDLINDLSLVWGVRAFYFGECKSHQRLHDLYRRVPGQPESAEERGPGGPCGQHSNPEKGKDQYVEADPGKLTLP